MDTTEQQQVEAIKHWWSTYGTKVIALIVLVGAGVLGWQYWQKHQIAKKTQASEAFFMITQLAKDEDVDAFQMNASTLIKQHSASPYAALASFMLAESSVQAGDYDQALVHLQWVADNGSASVLKDIANIRLARLQVEQRHFDAALESLDAHRNAVFDAVVEELKGDIFLIQHNEEQAIAAYRRALVAEASGLEARQPFIMMKLNDLGVDPSDKG